MVDLVLIVASLICLIMAAFNWGPARPHFGWLGVFLFVLTFLSLS